MIFLFFNAVFQRTRVLVRLWLALTIQTSFDYGISFHVYECSLPCISEEYIISKVQSDTFNFEILFFLDSVAWFVRAARCVIRLRIIDGNA